MFCPKCGNQMPDGTNTCGKCGAIINIAPIQAVPAPAKKKNKGCLIAILVCAGIALLIVIIVIAASCGAILNSAGSNGVVTSIAPGQSAASAATKKINDFGSSGTLGDYSVSIEDAIASKTYDDKPAMIIKFKWTNNSTDKISFSSAFSYHAYQNGVECQSGTVSDDSVDWGKIFAEVKPGATMEFNYAVELNDTSTPVNVEIQLNSLFATDDMVSATYTLK